MSSATIISHPADTLLSKVNKAGAPGGFHHGVERGRHAAETGVVKLCTQGLAARCVMIGTLTAGQFGIFDSVMEALGASKFHFHNPAAGPSRPRSRAEDGGRVRKYEVKVKVESINRVTFNFRSSNERTNERTHRVVLIKNK